MTVSSNQDSAIPVEEQSPLTLAMFPGQGSQYVGMGKELCDVFPKAKLVFEEASDAIGLDVAKLCFEGPEDQLKLTCNTQPAILTCSIAQHRVLVEEAGFAAAYFAGHSLGEYSALVAANILDFSRAVLLVRQRGEAMQEAVPAGVGAMAAVLKCDDLQARCDKISTPECIVEIANFNSPQQQVVAGHKLAVDALGKSLENDDIRFVPLPVSAPFHSRLMGSAREAMTPLLQDTQLADSPAFIIPNVTAVVTTQYEIKQLIDQIDSPVQWTKTIQSAQSAGCNRYVEVGPGRVLFGLARRILPRGLKMLSTDDMKKAISDLSS